MASLLTSAQKQSIEDNFDDIHDTFKEDIEIFIKEGPDIPVASTFDPLYGVNTEGSRDPSQKVEVKHTKQARIHYPDQGIEGDGGDINIPASRGRARLKVDLTTLELIKQATKIKVHGDLYSLDGDPVPQGPFSTNYYIVFLQRIN